MDTSISLPQMFEGEIGETSIADLEATGMSEDKNLARSAREMIKGVTDRLKPFLRYIVQPVHVLDHHQHVGNPRRPVRVIKLGYFSALKLDPVPDHGNSCFVFLGEDGGYFGAILCCHGLSTANSQHPVHQHFHSKEDPNDSTFEHLPLRVLFMALRDAFAEAQERREKHLASITKARKSLDAMVQFLTAEPSC